MNRTPTRSSAGGSVVGPTIARYVTLFQESAIWLAVVTVLFVVGILAGIAGASALPAQHTQMMRDMTERLGPALEALRSGDSARAIGMIFWNNVRIALVTMGSGAVVLGLFVPPLVIVGNAYMLGALAVISNQGIDRLLMSIVPHGIFEVPALLIAAAWGLKMGINWLLPAAAGRRSAVWRETIFEGLWIVPLVVVLLVVAALVEVLVTSTLVRGLSGG